MSFISPYSCLLRATRSLQLATASRTLSSSSRFRIVADAKFPVVPSSNDKLQPLTQSQRPVESPVKADGNSSVETPVKEWANRLTDINFNTRLPRSVQALYLRPLRRKAEYGLPVCDLQLRSYSVRNLEFFADFAIRAAYYLKLPVSGPVPLPKITERWTFIRSNFVHKKSKENFERITTRRLIQIKDGNPQAVQAWLAFLRKHAFYGIGMKANVWEYESLDVGKNMDDTLPAVEKNLEPHLSRFGRQQTETSPTQKPLSDFLGNERLSLKKGPLVKVRSV
ncbi:37S ribosomal protein S10, mitochondrial [Aspergillus pseudoustus]|uniref:37S ribosomal protein S10, mitochondrial n=1 Tax=Aspergillus pseudoustus TaxID=1810923 RepID=A0ABR4ISQ8_9EURO